MAEKSQTRDMADYFRHFAHCHPESARSPAPIYSDAVRGMDMFHFDTVTLDGRIYRVRVSDITPNEKD